MHIRARSSHSPEPGSRQGPSGGPTLGPRLRLVSVLVGLAALGLAAFHPSAPIRAAEGVLSPGARSLLADTLQGTVREASGQAVPTARVELRRGDAVLASTRTDRDGFFRLVLRDVAAGPLVLRVARFGYHSHESTVGTDAGRVDVVLDPAPLPLPGLDVEPLPGVCEADEDPDARALWEAVAQVHPGGLDTLGLATYLHGWTDTLGVSQDPDDEGRIGSPGQRGSAPLLRLSWDRRVQREGYAFPVRRTDRARSYDSWSYAPLEADFAPHFVDPTFGRLHRFQLEEAGSGGWILAFCGRNRGRPYLEGTLEVGPDSLLRRAEWRFRTDEPDETAGGWARFPDPTEAEPVPVPLPVESMTWRRMPDGEMLRKVQSYEGWILAPGDSVPFLRSRENGTRPGPDGGGGASR